MRTKTIKPFTRLFSAGSGLLLACLLGHAAFAADAEGAAAATAKAQPPIVVTLTQFKVGQDDKGAPKLLDAKLVLPGDVMEYRASYKNQSTAAISVAATLPIPEALEYIQDSAMATSASGKRIAHTVALVDSRFGVEPLMRKALSADGSSVTHAVPYAEYRFVRWNLDSLAPGASVEVSLRAKVAQTLAPATGAAQ